MYIPQSCGDDDDDDNNIKSQLTIKNRLSPAQINTGKRVRLLNISLQEQRLSSWDAGSLKSLPQHDCLSVFVITATPSVASK